MASSDSSATLSAAKLKVPSSAELKAVRSDLVHFVKMQGVGNDFVVLDGRYGLPYEKSKLAKVLCNRNYGIGADGLVVLGASTKADVSMAFFNPDGSEAICANGIRCLAKYVYQAELLGKDFKQFSIQTPSRVVNVTILNRGEKIRVDMGRPLFEGQLIPIAQKDKCVKQELKVGKDTYEVTAVGMGNPHCVVFVDDVEALDLEVIGPEFENHEFFPERTNVEFIQVLSRSALKMRVWERGVGETLACGTGVCASIAAAVSNELSERSVSMETRGGMLEVHWRQDNGKIDLTGPAEVVFTGEFTSGSGLSKLLNAES